MSYIKQSDSKSTTPRKVWLSKRQPPQKLTTHTTKNSPYKKRKHKRCSLHPRLQGPKRQTLPQEAKTHKINQENQIHFQIYHPSTRYRRTATSCPSCPPRTHAYFAEAHISRLFATTRATTPSRKRKGSSQKRSCVPCATRRSMKGANTSNPTRADGRIVETEVRTIRHFVQQHLTRLRLTPTKRGSRWC